MTTEFPTWRYVEVPTLIHRWRVVGDGNEWHEGEGDTLTGVPAHALIEVEQAILYPERQSAWAETFNVRTQPSPDLTAAPTRRGWRRLLTRHRKV